jgi:RNA polymerase sigma factor (sigma-70 family)
MSINKYKYKVNYRKLYPDTEISDKVMKVLRKSDRKMEYMEYDIKQEEIKVSEDKVLFIPCREDSLDRLVENGYDFEDETLDAEYNFFKSEEIKRVRQIIKMLTEKEQDLIQALFYDCLTEQEYADKIGVTQQNVNARKKRVLKKLKKLFLKVL